MVAITAAKGVQACWADVQQLPFEDGAFDLVVAAYMLYHVPDLPRALGEIARVLRRGGSLMALANSRRKLAEMWMLVGRDLDDEGQAETFSRESGLEQLSPYFETVERVDVDERFSVTETAARDYISATRFAEYAANLPPLPAGLEVTAAGSVFVATN
jgi:ubiquinone/menaquinone biosynthesis C-methylase UbiE